MARTDNLTNFLTDVAGAIKIKKGDSTPILASDFDTEIANLPSGGANLQTKSITITQNGITTVTPDTGYNGMDEVEITTNVGGELAEKDVNFYDYDGTLVYAYTKSEFLALTAYPANPSHTGLVAEGWNWDLAEAKSFVQTFGELDLGQYYKTSNGKTKVYIEIESNNMLDITFGLTARNKASSEEGYVNNTAKTITVNWGDNTTNSTATASGTNFSAKTFNHTYSTTGSYVISIEVEAGAIVCFGSSSGFSTIIRKQSQSAGTISVMRYLAMIKKIEFGDNGNAGVNYGMHTGAFALCSNLETITVSKKTGILGNSVSVIFNSCYKLKNLMFPGKIFGTTGNQTSLSMGSANFINNCVSIKKVLFPNINTNISTAQAISNLLIEKIIIPSIISPVDFGNMQNLKKVIANTPGSVSISKNATSLASNGLYTYCIEEIILGNFSSCTIANNGLNGYPLLKKLDLSKSSVMATMGGSSLGASISEELKIIVPDTLYNNYISDTYWSTYSSYIVKASEA